MIDVPETGDALLDRLAYGTGRLYRGDLALNEATVRRAYDLGIRHFDSSIGYGSAVPHAALGRLVNDPAVDRDSLFISTKIGKVGTDFPDPYSLYHNEDFLWGQVHECFRMLRGKIDLLQIHEADTRYWWSDGQDPDQPVSEADVDSGTLAVAPSAALSTLERARTQGVVRYVGITGNYAAQLAAVLRAAAEHVAVDSVMCAYNLDPVYQGTLEHVVPAARASGTTVLSAGILQGGAYRTPLELPRHVKGDPRVEPRFAEFDAIQKQSGMQAVELLLRWMLSAEGVDRWILGSSGPEQLDQTMEYLRRGLLPDDLQAALDALATPDLRRPDRDI